MNGNQSAGGFVWNRATLTERENQLLGATLEVFVIGVVNQRMLRAGRSQAIPDDAVQGIQQTLEWARMRFPDLSVDYHTNL